jgi:hypothetical protein
MKDAISASKSNAWDASISRTNFESASLRDTFAGRRRVPLNRTPMWLASNLVIHAGVLTA